VQRAIALDGAAQPLEALDARLAWSCVRCFSHFGHRACLSGWQRSYNVV